MFPNNHDEDQSSRSENPEPVSQYPVFSPAPRQDIVPSQPVTQPIQQPQSTEPVQQSEPLVTSTAPVQFVDQQTPSIQPAPSTTPAITVAEDLPSDKPKPKKRGLIVGIIVAAVVIIGFVAVALWYFLIYNSPSNVVIDAFTKALTAKSGTFDSTLSSGGASQTLKLNFNKDNQATADLALNIPMGAVDKKFAINLVADSKTLYIKIANPQQLLELVAGFDNEADSSGQTDVTDGTDLAVDEISDKWITVTSDNLKQLAGQNYADQSKCVEQQVVNLRDNSAISGELVKTYSDNPLFTVTAKGSDANGNKYELKVAPAKTRVAFLEALQNTKFFKGLDSCADGQLAAGVKDDIKGIIDGSDDSASKSTFYVWIDGGSHIMNKIEISDSSDGGSKIVVMTKFNTNPKITMPKAQLTINELENVFSGLMTSADTSIDTDTDL